MNMTNHTEHVILPAEPFRPSATGAFFKDIEVLGRKRSFAYYIPKNVRASTSGVFVFGENGTSVTEMLEKSNWAELAESDERKEKFIVFFLESDDQGWNLNAPEEDLAYVRAVYQESRARDQFCVHEAKYYLLGYREGGTMAQMAAMDNPAVYAGVASVNAPDVDADFVEKNGNAPCCDLNGYVDTEGHYGYRKKDFSVPAWIISNQTEETASQENIARYWRSCAGTEAEPRQLRPDVLEYYRTAPAPWTVNQEKEAFRVWISRIPGAAGDYGRQINRRLWSEFLRGVRRWMAEPGGDLRVTKDPVTDLGMEYHYERIGGWMREYYVYVPTYWRDHQEKPCPLVFASHGYSCSGEIYAGNSEWYKVAEERGFIVVFPSAVHGWLRSSNPDNPAVGEQDTELPAWNVTEYEIPKPNEIDFFDSMIERVASRHLIDRKRIYATGHSLGSIMTQYLGMARNDVFAAIAPCSGVLFSSFAQNIPNRQEVFVRKDNQLPVWMFGGEREEWLLEAVPTLENDTGRSIHIWWDLNHMTGEKPADFEAYRQADRGRWKDYIFSESETPLIRYTWVEEMPHATMTEMSYRIWDEFFSKFHRGDHGEVIYDV